jgi:DNA-binding MarR family transcriptional regulator
MDTLTRSDYESLAELRYQIRRFLRFSEQAARKAKIEPRQHQLLLALKGLPQPLRPAIGVLAERLQLRHHSAVELVNRSSNAGYIRRDRDGNDRREVRLSVTAKGEKVLVNLSRDHRRELRKAGPLLTTALQRVLGARDPRSSGRTRPALQ